MSHFSIATPVFCTILSLPLIDVDRCFPVTTTCFVERNDVSPLSTPDDQPTLADIARRCRTRTEVYLWFPLARDDTHVVAKQSPFLCASNGSGQPTVDWISSVPFSSSSQRWASSPDIFEKQPFGQQPSPSVPAHKKNTHKLRKRYYDSLR